MRDTRIIMGMPASLEIVRPEALKDAYERIFTYLTSIDDRFSTYTPESEVMRLNRGEITEETCSDELKEVMTLARETKAATHGYFDIRRPDGSIDPSGLVKGWAIQNAAELLRTEGYTDFYIEIAGDIQTDGVNAQGEPWTIGIRNPSNRDEIVKIVRPRGAGVATSGNYVRGEHIYDPHTAMPVSTTFNSFTVIGPNVYEADRMATAAYAMGIDGLLFIEGLDGFEAYSIDTHGIATSTTGFAHYVVTP
jgi:thiamine biosynthesis lipoprotein